MLILSIHGVCGAGKQQQTKRGRPEEAAAAMDVGLPHRTLFIEQLPDATTAPMLAMLFQQFPG
jgi:hypothetical protein